MTIRRSSLLRLVLWLGLFLLAIRPIGPLERAFDLLASPLRGAAEMTFPIVTWRSEAVLAAPEDAGLDLPEIEALWADLLLEARPGPELSTGRDLVPAEVVGRVRGDRDSLRVRVADATAIAPGQPVVHGDGYVGRVSAVDAASGLLEVDLVTGDDFAVGARLGGERGLGAMPAAPVWMTVGGVHSTRPGVVGGASRLALAVHNPSDRDAEPGSVVVDELIPDVDRWGRLASGFGLGRLAVGPSGERFVLADIDYGAGLYHVFVLCPGGARAGVDDALELAVADQDWRPSRPLSLGDPSPWRGGLVVATGSTEGVQPGSAVIAGLRLVGRVDRVSAWSSDVRLLTDPGLVVVAVARIEGSSRPHVLGRLVSLGTDRSGDWIRLRWDAVVDIELDGDIGAEGWLRAELFTGSGEEGLPGGVLLGSALLPARAEPDAEEAPIVYLERESTAKTSEKLWIRVVPDDPDAPGEDAL